MSLKTQMVAWLALLVAGILSLVWAYSYGGGADGGLLDRAGPAVTWGLPTAKLVLNLGTAGTIGALVLAVFVLPRGGTAYEAARWFAGWSAAVWAWGAAVHTYAGFLLLANRAPSAGFEEEFLTFITRIDAGRAGVLTTLIAAGVAILCFWVRSPRILAGALVAAFAGLLPLVLKSHAAGGIDHADSTTAIFLHAAAAAVWLGGLLTLVVLRRVLPAGQVGVVVRRYSTLALISYVALVVSGTLGALARISTVEALLSPYSAIVLAKAGVFIILGLFGVVHRRWSLGRIARDPHRGGRHFAALAVVELAVMGAASGMAAALARTEPPQAAASGGLDAALPGPDAWEYLSRWAPDPLWSLLCGFAVFAYLAGVRRLRAEGRSWPAYRTLLWLVGLAVLVMVTNGGVHVYQGYLFNAHVLTQMMLTAVVPLLLVPAAPLTLARLTVTARTDGSTWVKEFLERSVQPVLAALRRDPSLTIFVLAASLFTIYYTPLLEWAAQGQIGYSLMSVLALLSGCLVTAALTGTPDPGTSSSPRNRLPVLAGIAGLYAFGGWKLVEQAPAMELPWNTSVGRLWGPSPAAAAEMGGPMMWTIAAVALAIITATVIRRNDPHPGTPSQGPAGSAAPDHRMDMAS
ncbi:cytochrome c oxidase assembly protein [Pseudarthrobacter sulfonivorans]|uniref:cytochrome c oxidase assembly protein n=1 Tax=Pseudarthrobacter sulfonivorans TaxID=121292 RepID=UPI002856C225|nr:cytochrome c oxidase assembly protein [Pseudarthrobacter sulfonivorans]MDR6416398.1 putative copper resistance protein D [Pseudarthrobacter sulfonivorans]